MPMSAEQDTSLSYYLAELVLGIREAALTETDRFAVRQHLLDGLASGLAGCRSKEFLDLVGLSAVPASGVADSSDNDDLSILQDLGMLWAFAINGSVAEDGSREGACHPAAAVVPVIAAFSQGRSWDAIDRAVIAGYDVMVRMARCGNPHFARKGFHATAVAAPFGAAAAAAQLLGYDLQATQNALCLAAMGSSGLMASFKNGSTQPLQVAWGVRSGIAAALLAGKGNLGYLNILEEGFFPAYLGSGVDETIRRSLEYRYAINGCYLKPYPGCRHMHASLDAFNNIVMQHDLKPEHIDKIMVGTYAIAIDTGIEVLNKRGDAYFNIPYAIAARAVLGKSDHDAFDEKHFMHKSIIDLMSRVSISVDPEIEQRYPQQRGSKVEVHLFDGKKLTSRVEYPLGEPENPLPVSVTQDKFRANAGDVLSVREKEAMVEMLKVAGAPALLKDVSGMIMRR
jgi:2-methylcitrate dehydratase PrpD